MASVCGTQRDQNPEHLWSEADTNDAPGSAYSKSKTAAEAKVWELAEKYKDKYAVCTVHPGLPTCHSCATLVFQSSILDLRGRSRANHHNWDG